MNLFSAPTHAEWVLFAAMFAAIGLFIVTAEFLRHKFHGSPEITRKLVHILTGILIFFTLPLFQSGIPALLLAVVFIVVNFAAVQFGLLQGMHGTHRRTYGTVYYPLSFLVLVLLFWDSAQFIISVSILILALSDAIAAIIGENLPRPHEYRLTSDNKSYEGSAAMFVTTLIISVAAMRYFHLTALGTNSVLIGIAIALFTTGWEAISSRGFDNLTVPLSAALMLHYFFVSFSHHDASQMLTALVLAVLIAFISAYVKFLSPSGAAAVFLLATVIFGIGGWKWTVPILTFFIASSLLSKVGKARKSDSEIMFDKTDKRDEGQVAANGGVAGVIMLLWYVFPEQEFWYPCYLGTLAAVTADTWGTEIGTLSKKKPRSVITFKFVEPGTSGGISLIGLASGIFGAGMIVLSAWAYNNSSLSFSTAFTVILAGIVGSLIDSVFGAAFQAQYQTESGRITEKRIYGGNLTTFVHGVRWIDNDSVNLMCALTGAVMTYVLL
jgi:uncharacterized protein (TIGR00297 family)